MTRHRCTRNGNGWYWIYSMLCIVGLSSSILQFISLFALLHIIQSSSEIWYLKEQTPYDNPDYKVIILKSSWISYKVIHLFRKRGIIHPLSYIPKEYEKPITDLTMSFKVQYLLSITPFWNEVLSANNWDIISYSIQIGSNLLDTLPRSNQSVLICLPNRLSNSALNSMNLSKVYICEYALTPNISWFQVF